jgi:hypothetical protein
MKIIIKSLITVLLVSFTAHAQIPDIKSVAEGLGKDLLGGSINELFEMSQEFDNATAMCFEPKKSSNQVSNLGLCDYIEDLEKQIDDVDVCEAVPNPDPEYLTKKKFSLSEEVSLKKFCEDAQRALTSTVSDIDIFIKGIADENGTDNNIDKKASDMLKRADSPVRQALYTNNQKVIKEFYLRAQKSNGGSDGVADITLKDLSAPADYKTYMDDRKILIEQSISDYIDNSPYAVSSRIRSKVSSIQDSAKNASDEAVKISQEATEHIDRGTNVRASLYIDVLARDDDYAVPTQDMVNLLKEELRAEAVAKIRQQQKREALIISELKRIDEARKQLLAISGTKAVVISRKFDAAKTQEEIDKLIDGGSGGGISGGSINF